MHARLVSAVREGNATRVFVAYEQEELYTAPGEEQAKLRTANIEAAIDISDSEIEDARLQLVRACEKCAEHCAELEDALNRAKAAASEAHKAVDEFSPQCCAEKLFSEKLEAHFKKNAPPQEDAIVAHLNRMRRG